MSEKVLEKKIFKLVDSSESTLTKIKKSSFSFNEVMDYKAMSNYELDKVFTIEFLNNRKIEMIRPSEKNQNADEALYEVKMDRDTYWTNHVHPDCYERIILKKGSLFDYENGTYNFFDPNLPEDEQEFNEIVVEKGVWHFFKTDEDTEFDVFITRKNLTK